MVLTHGLGGKASHWSNDFSKNSNSENFAYDRDSLISKISDKVGGAYIYWGMMSGYNSFDLYDISNQTTRAEYIPTKMKCIVSSLMI